VSAVTFSKVGSAESTRQMSIGYVSTPTAWSTRTRLGYCEQTRTRRAASRGLQGARVPLRAAGLQYAWGDEHYLLRASTFSRAD
jgi:hypothetical protein